MKFFEGWDVSLATDRVDLGADMDNESGILTKFLPLWDKNLAGSAALAEVCGLVCF